MKRIYLDYAATTPVAVEVLQAMQPYFSEKFGNAGSLHFFGQEASKALDESRETIAKALGVDFREIIFTGSATEANNLALRGLVKNVLNVGDVGMHSNKRAQASDRTFKPRIITSSVEHESILETCRDLEKGGVEVIYLPVDKDGVVQLTALRENLSENTILVSIGGANNEIGVTQPIAEIAKIIREFRKQKVENRSDADSKIHFLDSGFPLFHNDNAQGFQYLDLKPKKLGIDLMTISAHKIYGPKGVAALYINHKSKIKNQNLGSDFIAPIITGGGQEYGLRSGTENIPGVVGFAKAVEITRQAREQESKRVGELRDYFWRELKKISPKAELNGPALDGNRLPNNLNIYFPKNSSEDMLIKLDMAGIAVSAGSACSARSTKLSHVLQACGLNEERIKSSLRITLGRPTTKEEVDEALRRIKKVIG